MAAGRPRQVSLSPKEMIALGKEMVEWVKQNKPLHLKQWYCIEKMITYNEWKVYITCEEFFPYYEQALAIVGLQYLDKDSRIREGISQRWQRVYFKDLKEEEDETAIFNAQISKQAETQGTEEQNKKLDQLLDVMRNTQHALKSEDKSSNNE